MRLICLQITGFFADVPNGSAATYNYIEEITNKAGKYFMLLNYWNADLTVVICNNQSLFNPHPLKSLKAGYTKPV